MRRTLTALAALVILTGCANSSDGSNVVEPRRLNGKDPKIEALIQDRYGDCLVTLRSGPVKFKSGNIYVAGPLAWTAMTSETGAIRTFPTSDSIDLLKTVGC